MIRNLHNLHLVNLNSANIASFLEEIGHVVADQGGVGHEAGFVTSRLIIESRASSSDNFKRLVVNIALIIIHSKYSTNWICNLEINDDRHIHR